MAQGTVVQVLARQNGMSCVITPEGKSGWINSSYLLRIRPEAGWMLTEAVYRDGEGKEEQHITYRYNEDGLLEEVSRSEEEDGIPAVIRYDRDGMPLGLPYGYVYDSLGQSFHGF